MPRFLKTTTGSILFGLDMILDTFAWPIILWVSGPDMMSLFQSPMDVRAVVFPAFNLLLLFAMGLYRREAILNAGRSLTRVPLVVGMGATAAILVSLLQPMLMSTARNPTLHDKAMLFGLAVVIFTLCAFLARLVVDVMVRSHVLRRRLLIIGAGQRAWDLLHILGREGGSLHDHVTLVHHPLQGDIDPRLLADRPSSILTIDDFNVAVAARDLSVDLIIVAPDERRGMSLERLLECKKAGFPVMQYLSFVEREIRRIDLKRMELGWLVYTDGFTFGTLDRFLKRGFDLAVSGVVLLVTAPLVLGAIIAIRWEGPGPIFYRQDRVTRDGRIFPIMKLRTMRTDAEAKGAIWAMEKDNRITRTGAFLAVPASTNCPN